jgi:hypothetical protein
MNVLSENPRRWIHLGFLVTLPTLLFWASVAISLFFKNHQYVDALISYGGSLSHILLIAVLPLMSTLIALGCKYVLRRDAVLRNIWHRETKELRISQSLINWNVVLISIMVISLINN